MGIKSFKNFLFYPAHSSNEIIWNDPSTNFPPQLSPPQSLKQSFDLIDSKCFELILFTQKHKIHILLFKKNLFFNQSKFKILIFLYYFSNRPTTH